MEDKAGNLVGEETSTLTNTHEHTLKFVAIIKTAREYVIQGARGGVVPKELLGTYSNLGFANKAIESYYRAKNTPKRVQRRSRQTKRGVSSGRSKNKS